MLGIIFIKSEKDALIKGQKTAHILSAKEKLEENQSFFALVADSDNPKESKNFEKIGTIKITKICLKKAGEIEQEESWNCNYKRMWELKNLLFKNHQIKDSDEIQYIEFSFFPLE